MRRLLSRYRAWRGEPPLRWPAELAFLADEMLDRIPRREDGRWYRYGDWGCQLGLSRWYVREEHERPGRTAR